MHRALSAFTPLLANIYCWSGTRISISTLADPSNLTSRIVNSLFSSTLSPACSRSSVALGLYWISAQWRSMGRLSACR